MDLGAPILGVISSVLTRPNNTTAYSTNKPLIASSTVAGSLVVPSFTLAMPNATRGAIKSGRLIMSQNNIPSTVTLHIDLWAGTAPTFTNGDGGNFAPASGSAGWIGHLASDPIDSYGDGSACLLEPVVNLTSYYPVEIGFEVAPNTPLYWTLQESDATGFTPTANSTFTLILPIYQQ